MLVIKSHNLFLVFVRMVGFPVVVVFILLYIYIYMQFWLYVSAGKELTLYT